MFFKRIREIRYDINKLIQKYLELDRRISKLERDSHKRK